jgi:hypothetical protein
MGRDVPDAVRQQAGRVRTFFRWFRHAQGGTKPLRIFCVLACLGLAYHAGKFVLIWRSAPHYDVLLVAMNFCSLIVLQIIALSVSYCFYLAETRAAGG